METVKKFLNEPYSRDGKIQIDFFENKIDNFPFFLVTGHLLISTITPLSLLFNQLKSSQNTPKLFHNLTNPSHHLNPVPFSKNLIW